jgi:hypothetical protein
MTTTYITKIYEIQNCLPTADLLLGTLVCVRECVVVAESLTRLPPLFSLSFLAQTRPSIVAPR